MSGVTYLDYQATTPVAPEVAAAMRPWIEDRFGNPHSPHRVGREAAAAVEVARGHVRAALGAKGGRLFFTSGVEVHWKNGSIYGADNVDPSAWLEQNARDAR